MAMRPSTVLFLLTIAIVIVSISSKRIIRKGKAAPAEKKKDDVKAKAVKKKTEESEEESSEYEYSDEDSSEDSDKEEKKKSATVKHSDKKDKKKKSETLSDSDQKKKSKTVKEKEKVKKEESTEEVEESEDEDENTDHSEDKGDDESLSVSSSEEFKGEHRSDMEGKGIFYSLKSIKAFLTQPLYEDEAEVTEVLKRFNSTEVQAQEKLQAYQHKQLEAFYVVEGVNPDTKRKVAQTLAHRLKGLYLVNQPRILLGPVPKDAGAKRAYYALSKYAIANKVLISLFHRPVVIENYWTEHASYIMSKVWPKANKLPTPSSDVYKFPEDLLRPNVTFAIYNSPPPRLGKTPSKTYLREQRQLLVYKRVTGANIHIVRFPESPKQLSDKIDMFLLNQGPRKPPVSFEITLAE